MPRNKGKAERSGKYSHSMTHSMTEPKTQSIIVPRFNQSMTLDDDMQGWLWVKTGILSSWKFRYFSLRGALLTYYEKYPGDEYFKHKPVFQNETSTAASMQALAADQYAFVPIRGETTPCGVLRVAHIETAKKSQIAFKVFAVSGKILDIRAENPTSSKRWTRELVRSARLGRRKEIPAPSSKGSSTSTDSTSSWSDEDAANVVDKVGWLKTKERGKWRNRYFVLQGKLISLHEDELSWTVPKIRAYVTQVQPSTKKDSGLDLYMNGGKKYILHATDKDERDAWVQALQSAVNKSSSRKK